jgi:hypothetical protein
MGHPPGWISIYRSAIRCGETSRVFPELFCRVATKEEGASGSPPRWYLLVMCVDGYSIILKKHQLFIDISTINPVNLVKKC